MSTTIPTAIAKQNKALMERYFEEVFNQRNAAFEREMISPAYVVHCPDFRTPGELVSGPSVDPGIDFFAAIPDYRVTIDKQFAEGDTVVSLTTMRGTFSRELPSPWGIFAPTGKPVVFTWVSVNRLEDGKIVEAWLQWDLLGLLVQLGMVKMPEKQVG